MKKSLSKKLVLITGALMVTWAVNTHAAETQLMTPVQMLKTTALIKNEDTKEALAQMVAACTAKQWGVCQEAWWNLQENGHLLHQVDPQTGFESLFFKGQPEANKVLTHLLEALNHPLYQSAWDMEVTPSKRYKDLPNIVEGRKILTDGAEHKAVLDILQERFAQSKSTYNVREEMNKSKYEWLRMVTLMYAVRGDATSAYQSLSSIQKYANINTEITAQYNALNSAVVTYLKQQGTKK